MCLIALLVLIPSLFAVSPDSVVPAVNEIEVWEFDRGTILQQVGSQPYEMTWVQRRENPHTLVDFEDLKGWTLELYGGAEGELYRTREQQMWGQYVAKILYSSESEKSRVVARPPEPIPIPGKFDSVEMWGYADRRRHRIQPGTPTYISALVKDSSGTEHRLQMTHVRWMHWWLVHYKVQPEELEKIVWPASFSGIEISMETKNPQQRYLYCDSLAFYVEELRPLKLNPQPKRNLKPFRGQIAGTNTGPGTLPFPTREETILPTNFETNFRVSVRELETHRYELAYEGNDVRVAYEYRPRAGNLSELSVSVDRGPYFRPMDGGGVRFEDTAEGELISAALDGDVVKARFRYGPREVGVRAAALAEVAGDGCAV